MTVDRRQLMLYAVTDRSWLGGRTLEEQVEEAIEGGVTFLQLREKTLDREAFFREALTIREICRKHGIPLIINDDWDIAKRADADGVHVGQSDLEAGKVRELLGPDKIIGVSAHSVEEALRAEERGADYLGVGAVFPTGTKKDAGALSRETLRAICDAVRIPVVAIGGITRDNVMELAGTGICGAAVVSGIFARENTRAAAEDMKAQIGRMLDM